MTDSQSFDLTPEVNFLKAFSPKTAAVVEYVAERSRWAANRLKDSAVERSQLPEDEFIRRLSENDRLAMLFLMAVDAAQRSYVREKTETLAQAVASGVLATDEAKIDEAQLLVATLTHLEAPHFRVLMVLATWAAEKVQREADEPVIEEQPATLAELPPFPSGERSIADVVAAAMGISLAATQSIVATLVQQGCLTLDPPGFTGFFVTAWGQAVLTEVRKSIRGDD